MKIIKNVTAAIKLQPYIPGLTAEQCALIKDGFIFVHVDDKNKYCGWVIVKEDEHRYIISDAHSAKNGNTIEMFQTLFETYGDKPFDIYLKPTEKTSIDIFAGMGFKYNGKGASRRLMD